MYEISCNVELPNQVKGVLLQKKDKQFILLKESKNEVLIKQLYNMEPIALQGFLITVVHD